MNLSPGGELLTQATRRLGRDDTAGVSVGEWCLIIIGFVIVGLFVDRFTHKSWLCCRWCARCCDTCLNGKPLEPEVPPPPPSPKRGYVKEYDEDFHKGGGWNLQQQGRVLKDEEVGYGGAVIGDADAYRYEDAPSSRA